MENVSFACGQSCIYTDGSNCGFITAFSAFSETHLRKLLLVLNTLLNWNYTTRFGNFIFNYNFLTNSLKLIKVYIIRKGISQGRQCGCWYFTKNHYFLENPKKKKKKKRVFFQFFFRNRLEKLRNSKTCFWNVLLT